MYRRHEQTLAQATVRLIVVTALAAGICSCGGSQAAPESVDSARNSVSFEQLTGGIGSAELNLTPVPGASRATGLSFSLRADSAAGLKAVYGRLRYDAARWKLGALTPSRAWGESSALLALGQERAPGVADVGIVLANYDQRAGLNGSTELGQIVLLPQTGGTRQEAAGLAVPRRSSLTPVTWDYTPEYLSAFPPQPETSFKDSYTIDRHAALLHWTYSLPGDYDQNGEVNISDLTALATHFGEVQDPQNPWDPDAIQSVLDGDDNGEIGLSDIVPMGRNYGIIVEAWTLYYKVDVLDNDYGSTASLGQVLFSAAVGDTALERIHFSLQLADVQPSPLYRLVATANGVQASAGAIPTEPSDHPVRYYFVPPSGLNWYGLSWNSAEAHLDYALAIPGDGDWNDEVNVADLTPIGTNFGRVWDNPNDGPFSTIWYADYNKDGICDFVDIEILAFNWACTCDGYLFYATFNPSELPEPYSYPLLDPIDPLSVQSGQYVWLRPYVGDPSDPLNIGAPSQVIQVP